MLKGIAQAGNNELPEDRYGIIVALSDLSGSVSGADADSAMNAAAEAASALLHVPAVCVFTEDAAGNLSLAGSAGVNEKSVSSAAEEIARKAITEPGPLVYSNLASIQTDFARRLAKRGFVSTVCVPMRLGEKSIGAIVALSEELRAFSPSDVELLHVVASQAALAVWKSVHPATGPETVQADQDELIQLAQRKIQDLSLINQVSEAINSTLDLDELLGISLKQSMMAVGADAGSLMLVNEDTGKLEIAVSRGLDVKRIARTSQNIGVSIAGWVAEQGESVLVTDAHADPRFKMPFYRDAITSSASIPVKSKSGVIGVLNVNTVQHGKLFDERDLEILGTIANQVAVAIENARLYARVNRRTQQLSSLLQISRTVGSTLNLNDVLHRLAHQICRVFELDVCVLLSLDDLSDRFRFDYGQGLKARRRSTYYDLAAPLAARVRATGKRLVLRNIGSSASLRTTASREEKLKTALCIPLKNRGRLVGVAAGFSHAAKKFKRSQLDITGPLGDLAGVAIQNARIYGRKYRMAELLEQRLVPSKAPVIERLDIGHKFLPARQVGGDFYDFPTVAEDKVGVVVADVAGNDVEAAEYTTMGKHVLRAYARHYLSPAKVLSSTNDLVCEDTRDEMFISLFYGVVDLGKRTLAYANAGCEPPLLFKAADGKVEKLAAGGILLGIAKGMCYDEREVTLHPGDVVVIYTDGLVEAAMGSRRFGVEAVMRLLKENSALSAQEIADNIHDALLEFVHGRVKDDVALVVLKLQ